MNLGLARKFSLAPLHDFVAGQRGSAAWLNWQGLPSAELKLRHPQALRLPPSLPAPNERGECPTRLLPGICPRGIPGAPGPFPRVAHAHYTNPVPWTHSLLWPTTPVPWVPSTQYAHFNSHAPSRSMNSCTPPKGIVPSYTTNNRTTSFW